MLHFIISFFVLLKVFYEFFATFVSNVNTFQTSKYLVITNICETIFFNPVTGNWSSVSDVLCNCQNLTSHCELQRYSANSMPLKGFKVSSFKGDHSKYHSILFQFLQQMHPQKTQQSLSTLKHFKNVISKFHIGSAKNTLWCAAICHIALLILATNRNWIVINVMSRIKGIKQLLIFFLQPLNTLHLI